MPVSTASVSTYTLNVGIVSVAGSFIGMPLDAMVLGAIAGGIVHGRARAGTRLNGIVTVLISTILAGAFSPAIVGWAVHNFDFGDPSAEVSMMKPLIPVIIGAVWPWLAPMVHQGVKQVFDAAFGRIVKLIEFFGGSK